MSLTFTDNDVFPSLILNESMTSPSLPVALLDSRKNELLVHHSHGPGVPLNFSMLLSSMTKAATQPIKENLDQQIGGVSALNAAMQIEFAALIG